MSPEEYEEFVSELVRQLDFCKHGNVFRSRKFQGVRQPGEYEIDVGVEVRLSDTIDFLLIVECKNWKRPVDRPVIQKLAQTRDAIGAHKAAVVSPIGFTKEAMAVSKVHGIALWVVSEANWDIIVGISELPLRIYECCSTRRRFLESIGFCLSDESVGRKLVLLDAEYAHHSSQSQTPWVRFVHDCTRRSSDPLGSGEPGMDPRTAISQVIDELSLLV